jgi:AcrR family transcriptional regulator
MTTNTKRQKRHLLNKQNILQAARDIIKERGVNGLSMRELADRVDYSHSGLYEYFSGKEEIIAVLCVESWERLTNRLKPSASASTPSEQLLKSAMAYLDFAQNYPDEYLLMFATRQTEAQSFAAISDHPTFTVLMLMVQTGVESGEFKPGKDAAIAGIAYRLWVLVHGMAMMLVTHFQAKVTEEVTNLNRQIIELTIADLRRN